MKTSKPFPDLEALKKSTDLAAVVRSYGIKLEKQGNDLVGICPFHQEDSGSFKVTPSKNLFHCFGCGAGGSVMDFVVKKEGLTKQQAIDWMVKKSGGAFERGDRAQLEIKNEKLEMKGQAAALLKRVVAFYAKTLLQDRDGYDYLKTRNLVDPTMLEVFQVGYCNGTLYKSLPKSGEIIEGLKSLGILGKRGEEIFRGRITVPIFDAAGNVSSLYARAIRPCEASQRHRYLRGEHKGVWNGATAKTNQTLFVTESIFDAMSLWQAGFKNVISLYGSQSWTPDHEALIRENGVTEIYLCLDSDEGGHRAAEQLREKLSLLIKAVHIIAWPDGVKDANDFFLSRSTSDFEKLLPKKEEGSHKDSENQEEQIEMLSNGFVISYGVRRYELRAIEKPSSSRLKATVKALGVEAGRFHIDTVDFYLSRSRRGFIIEAARLFRDVPEVIEVDVNRLIVQLESYIEKRLEEKTPAITLVSESEKAEALKLGKNPDLVGEILRDMEKLGAVGETTNKLIGYLVMTSRKMDDPLALLTLSGSGAGKSHLQDTILSLCSEEDLIKLTSLSDRALFYKGENSLMHKVLAIEEEAGASGAHYAIRNLISSKKLVIETTIKNPLTGKMETQVNTVRGPTAVFQTTTNPETDAETKSRFIITSVDESLEQTRAILEAQRNSHTLEGLERRYGRSQIITRHHAFQRMLKSVKVVNPFEPLLGYGEDRLLFRRDHPKYLSLILAVAFLYQMQRPIKQSPVIGDYIEATLDDIAIANELAHELFGSSLDDLSLPSRELLQLIFDYVHRKAANLKTKVEQIEFGRRELREALKWSEPRLRTYLKQLVEMEYVIPVRGSHGQTYNYRLVYQETEQSTGRFLPGLKSVEELRQEAKGIGLETSTSLTKIVLRRSKSNFVGTSSKRFDEVGNGHFPSENGNGRINFVELSQGHINGVQRVAEVV